MRNTGACQLPDSSAVTTSGLLTIARRLRINADRHNDRAGSCAPLKELADLVEEVSRATGIAPSSSSPKRSRPRLCDLRRETLSLAVTLAEYDGGERTRRWGYVPRRSIADQLASLRNHQICCGATRARGLVRSSTDGVNVNPLEGEWFPVTSQENLNFRSVSIKTHCLFASKSVSWAAEAVRHPASDAEMDLLARRLYGFTRAVRADRLDCFVATFPQRFGADVQTLGALTHTVLRALKRRDGRRTRLGDPGRPGWKFRFDRETYFVLAMGSCYPRTHSRYTFDLPSTILVFQPDAAFERAVSPSGKGLISMSVRRSIRAAFAEAGMQYDLRHTESALEADRFVKPVEHGVAPIAWWQIPAIGPEPGTL